MKRSLIILIAILTVFALAILVVQLEFNKGVSGKVVSSQPILLTEENLPRYLESMSIVKELPKDASLNVNFGNKLYSVTKGHVNSDSNINADIIVNIPEKYLGKEYDGICDLVKEAVNNRDVSVDTTLSKTQLLWKYRSLIKYKSCITG